MEIKEIEELIRLIEGSEIEEFELERAGTRIRVKKSGSPAVTPAAAGAGGTQTKQSVDADVGPAAGSGPPDPAESESVHTFKAPIVGTFFLTPKPDAEPFVQVGDEIHQGDVICIIEAMKIFNQIEADVEGRLLRILVKNGQAVEYGQALFEIRVSAQSDVQEDTHSESR